MIHGRHLGALKATSSAQSRVAVELLIDSGRRPGEICALPLDCLDRDRDGRPVLVYDNDKSARMGRRLPIGEACGCQKVGYRYAAWEYSPISPPRRSRRTTRDPTTASGGRAGPSGGACASERCGRCAL